MKGMRVGNEFSATREHEEGGTDRTGLRGRVAETTQGCRLLFWSGGAGRAVLWQTLGRRVVEDGR